MRTVLWQLRKVLAPCGKSGASDWELLERFASLHDDTAFEVLVWRHHRMVLSVCGRVLSDTNDVEDAFQATFLVLARKAGSIRRTGPFSSWLFGVARRVSLEVTVRGSRHHLTDLVSVPSSGPDPCDEMFRKELHGLIDEELGHIPEKYRAPVVLCYLEGLTYEEAGRQLGCSKGTVSTRLTRARELLRKRLVNRGLALSPGVLAAWLCQQSATGAQASLVASTIKAATQVAVGQSAGLISPKVAALANGVLNAMLLTKIKTVAGVFLALGAVISGGVPLSRQVAAAHHGQAEAQLAEEKRADAPPAEVASPEKAGRGDEAETPTFSSRSLKGEYKFVSMSFGRDGKALATVTREVGSEAGDIRAKCGVRLWDVRSGSERTLAEDQIKDRCYHTVAGVGLSADGKTVAAPAGGRDGEWLFFWDAETGKIRHKLKHYLEVRAIAFSPDSKVAASGTGGNTDGDFETVKLWDVESGKLLRTLKTTNKEAVKIAFAPDGKLLAAILHQDQAAAEVILWDPAEGKPLQALPASEGIEAIAFSSDGKVLLGATRTKLRKWDVITGKIIEGPDLKTNFGDKEWSAYAFSPNGQTLSIAGKQDDKHVIAVYDVGTAKRTKTLVGHTGFISALSFSPDSKTLASCGYNDETIYLWDLDREGELKK